MPPEKKREKELPIKWKKKAHGKPVKDKLLEQKEYIRAKLYDEEIGIPDLLAELETKGISSSIATLRTFVATEFAELGSAPIKRKKGSAVVKLDEVKEDIDRAVYESDLSFSDINRNLKEHGIEVSLASLIRYIDDELFSLKGKPERFKKDESQ